MLVTSRGQKPKREKPDLILRIKMSKLDTFSSYVAILLPLEMF